MAANVIVEKKIKTTLERTELSPKNTESHGHNKKNGRSCFRSRVKKKSGYSLLWKTDTYIPHEDSIWYRSTTILQLLFSFVNFPSVCSSVQALQTTWTFSSCIFLFPRDHFNRGISTLSKSRLLLFVSGKADGENKSLIYDLEDTFVWQDFVTSYTSFLIFHDIY